MLRYVHCLAIAVGTMSLLTGSSTTDWPEQHSFSSMQDQHARNQLPGGPPDRRRGPANNSNQVTPEMRTNIIAVISDLRDKPLTPAEHRRLRAMPQTSFRKFFSERADRILALARTRQFQPRLYELKIKDYKLNREAEHLARRIGSANSHDKPETIQEAKGKLRTLVENQVDVRFQVREHEIKISEERLKRMRTALASEKENRTSVINQRVEMLLNLRGRREYDDRNPKP